MSEQGRLRVYRPRGSKRFHIADIHTIWAFCGGATRDWPDLGAAGPIGGESVSDFAARVEFGSGLSLCGNCRRAIPNYCAGCGRRKGHGHDEGCSI